MATIHYNRIMVLIDDIWRLATPVPDSLNADTVDIQAELNGLIISIAGGRWYNVNNRMTDDQANAQAVMSNIEQLYSISAQKENHRKSQEKIQERLRRAEQQVQNPQPQPAPVVELITAVDEMDDFTIDDYEYGECDCEDCRLARGES